MSGLIDSKFHIRWNFLISFILLVLLNEAYVKGHYDEPYNPCPDIFQYHFHDYDCYGVINHRNYNESPLSINIKLVINHKAHYNGSLEPLRGTRKQGRRKHGRGRSNSNIPTSHKVNFPFFGQSLPEIEEIRINDEIVCRGQPERIEPFSVIQLEHNYGSPIDKRHSNCDEPTTTASNNPSPSSFSPSLSSPDITPLPAASFGLQPSEQTVSTSISEPSVLSSSLSEQPMIVELSAPSPSEQPIITEMSASSSSQAASESPPIMSQSTDVDNLKDSSSAATASRQSLNSMDSCGELSVSGPIIDGNKVDQHSWPWLAAIFLRSGLIIKLLKFNCGGSIISPKFVLTAAHCFRLYGEDVEPDDVHVAVGAHNLFITDGNGAQLIPSEDVFMHPDFSFDSKNFDADVALISLLEPVTFSDIIRPICLWSDSSDVENIVGREGTIVSWSKDEANLINAEPRILQTKILPQTDCLNQSASINSTRIFCSPKLTEQDKCGGNAGTGLMFQTDNKWFLRGVISAVTIGEYSITCNYNENVIYTDVAKYTDWIKTYLNK